MKAGSGVDQRAEAENEIDGLGLQFPGKIRTRPGRPDFIFLPMGQSGLHKISGIFDFQFTVLKGISSGGMPGQQRVQHLVFSFMNPGPPGDLAVIDPEFAPPAGGFQKLEGEILPIFQIPFQAGIQIGLQDRILDIHRSDGFCPENINEGNAGQGLPSQGREMFDGYFIIAAMFAGVGQHRLIIDRAENTVDGTGGFSLFHRTKVILRLQPIEPAAPGPDIPRARVHSHRDGEKIVL